jgi:Uncharacterized protein conserved in bacteria (DUF2171)
VDEGLPIAYEVLENGVPVYSSDGTEIGTVARVIASDQVDIFHGIVIRAGLDHRFIAADQIASMHERGVDLAIDAAAAAQLPQPTGEAPAYRLREPDVKPSRWRRILDELEGKSPLQRDWAEEE